MEPNLATVRCKQILLKKLTYAVVSSVFSQIFILILFLFTVNFSLIHPNDWIKSTLSVVISINTWLFLIPFSCIIFCQSVICAKDYVLQSQSYMTRFQKVFEIVSMRNFVLLVLHVVVGGLHTWLYLFLSGLYDDASYDCKNESCVRRQHVFLIASGLFVGLYFFVRVYIKDKKLDFPVIQQRKWLQLKGNIVPLLSKARRRSVWPVLYFGVLYYVWGQIFCEAVSTGLRFEVSQDTVGFLSYFYAYLLGMIYFFNMNLMRFLFNLFLTEPIEFPLEKNEQVLTLQEAITSGNLPLVQHLACLDLFLLSFWSENRRQVLFSLSHPGCHPYNWNNLIENVLKLFGEYVQLLNKSVDLIAPIIQKPKPKDESVVVKNTPLIAIQSPIKSPGKYPSLRNMSLRLNEPSQIISYNETIPAPAIPTQPQKTVANKIKNQLNIFATKLKKQLGYNYLFDELPEANLQKCLNYGQIIMWTSQGIAELATASYHEDKFGVVQNQLPMLLTSLTQLKMAMERLNMVPALGRRYGQNNYNYKLKLAILNAVKRSLVNVSKTFGEFFGEMKLSKEVQQQLQMFVPSRSG